MQSSLGGPAEGASMTTTEVATLKRTELQAAACRTFGKGAAAWTGRATNEELRDALTSGEVPAKFANGNGSHPDLALATFVEAKLAERAIVRTFEVQRPDGSRIN